MFNLPVARLGRHVTRALVLAAPRHVIPSRHRRPSTVAVDDTPPPVVGGPFLHWVPDQHGGLRLAGEYVPLPARPASESVARHIRRRR